MLNRMLRYADTIVKRGVDKLIDLSDIVWNRKVKTLKHSCAKNACAMTLTANNWQHYELRFDRTDHHPYGRTVPHALQCT